MLFQVSCRHESEIGCKDPAAVNYNSEAEVEDNSCIFEGDVVFYYTEDVSVFYQADGADTIFFYLNQELIGFVPSTVFWNEAPNCFDVGSVGATYNLGSNTSGLIPYRVEDQLEVPYFIGEVDITANECRVFHLEL